MSASAPTVRKMRSSWCNSRGKRWMDIVLGFSALLMLSPLLMVIAVAIRLTSGRPVLFRQWRTGRYGRQFELIKFRTMESSSVDGPPLTRAGDPRVTSIGKWLRTSKLDELPQFLNVLSGDMSLVGPRPDLEEFWNRAPSSVRQALALRPGLTGAASIAFRNEESLLAQIEPDRVASFYRETLLPTKARIDLEYASRSTFLSDCGILLRTLIAALGAGPTTRPSRKLDEQFSR